MLYRTPLVVTVLAAVPLLLNAALENPPTVLGMVGAAALLAALLAAGHALARRLLGQDQPAPSVLSAAGVAATALLVLPALALGHFGWLDPRLYLAVEVGLTLAVTAGLARISHQASSREGEGACGCKAQDESTPQAYCKYVEDVDRPATQQTHADSHSQQMAGEKCGLGRPEPVDETGPASDDGGEIPLPAKPDPRWPSAVLAGAFALALVTLISTAHVERNDPATKLDDSSYHLVTVATWIQHQDLRMPLFQSGDPSTPYYPVVSEVIDWAAVAPLRDSDFLARWAQLPFMAGLLAATAGLALRLGATPTTTALAMLLLLSIRRLYPDLTLSAANDVMQAYFTVAAADALAAWWARSRRALGPALYFGTGLGLMLGTKYLGVLLASPLIVAAIALPWLRGRTAGEPARPGLGAHFRLLALASATAAVVGGYSYLRNWVSVGNPIFPIPLSLGPFDLPGWIYATKEWRSGLPEFAIRPWAFLITKVKFTGLTYHFTLLPAAVLAPLVCVVRRRGRRWPLDLVLLCLPALFYLLFVVRVYDHRDVRYLFSAYALAAVAFAWVLQNLPTDRLPARRWLPALLCATVLIVCCDLVVNQGTLLRDSPVAHVTTAAAAFAAGSVFAFRRLHLRWWRRPRRLALGLFAGSLVVAAALAPAADTHQREKYADDPVVQTLAREDPTGARVLVFGGNRWYRLFGARLQNQVLPGEVGVEHAWYRWGDERTDPASQSRNAYWMWRLRGEQDSWLVVHPASTHPQVLEWLQPRLTPIEMRATANSRQLWHVDDLSGE